MVRWSEDFLQSVQKAAQKDNAYQKLYQTSTPMYEKDKEAKLLYRRGCLVIPNDPNLRKEILASEHDSQVASH